MINLQNILQSPVENDPWPYKIVDDILDKEVYFKILKSSEKLVKSAAYEKRDPNGLWMYKAKEYGIDQDIIDLIMEINLFLLKNSDKVLKDFPHAMKSKIGYFSIPRFNYLGPQVTGTIHDEGDSKTMALVIYLMPEESIGTHLYRSVSIDSYYKTIEWKPNRGFLMISQPGVTYHSFQSLESHRLTLNFYYEKFEKVDAFRSYPIEKQNWFWEEFSRGRNAIINENV